MTVADAHLTAEELIDVAENAGADTSVPHLAACDRCRDQLADLRAVLAAARDVAVPEPSPIFWTQFSRRVSDAVANEPPASRRWFEWTRPRVFIPVSALAIAAMVLAVVPRPSDRIAAPGPTVETTASAEVDDPADDVAGLESDSSLNLVADLTAGLDLGAAMDAGLTRRDSAEHAVTHMNADELRALQRLLKEELARGGA